MHFKWFDRSGFELATAGDPLPQTGGAIAMSPDEQDVTLSQTTEGNTDVWALELVSGRTIRLTTDAALDITPTFSGPTRGRVDFTSNRTGTLFLYEKSLTTRLLRKGCCGLLRLPDEPSMLLQTGNGCWPPASGDPRGRTSPCAWAPALLRPARWHYRLPRDGCSFRRMAGGWPSSPTSRAGMKIDPATVPERTARQGQPREGGAHVRWNPNGRELLYIAPNGALTAVPVTLSADGQSAQVGTSSALFVPPMIRNVAEGTRGPQYAVAGDGSRFLVATVPTVNSPIQIVRNWRPGSFPPSAAPSR